MERLSHYGSIAGSVMAILAAVGFFVEPFLEDYVDSHIETYEERRFEEDSKKIGFRKLLGEKMDLDDDEVHIEIGHWYKKEKIMYSTIDSLENVIGGLKTEDRALLNDINANYKDILDLQKKLEKAHEKHGLFN